MTTTPTVLYVTHETLEWDPDLDDGNTHVAQLKVGVHVVLEARFYAGSGYDADQEAAEAVGEKLNTIFAQSHTPQPVVSVEEFEELKGQVSRLVDAANDAVA